MKKVSLLLALTCYLTLCVPPACAQWQTQTLTLQPGWNSVFLSIDPTPADCDALFGANARILSVRRWAPPPVEAVQYDETTGATIPQSGSWLAWFPAAHTNRALVNLSLVAGGAAYLFEVSAGTQVLLNLQGRPLVQSYQWQPGSHHFVGLPVVSSAVTFSSFFASASNSIPTDYRVGGELYTVLNSGGHQMIFTPATAGINPGVAYWIKAREYSTYGGPISLKLDSVAGWMDFGRRLLPRYLEIRNATTAPLAVKLAHLTSAAPPGGTPALAGPVPLKFAVVTGSSEAQGRIYQSFPATWTTSLAAGAALRLAFIPDAAGLVGNTNSAFQSIVEVTDTDAVGFPGLVRQRFGVRAMARSGTAAESVGLWVGEVSVTGVGRLKMPQATFPTLEMPVARPFNFRILAHVDNTGKAQLLQRIFVGTRPDTVSGGVITDLLATEARVSVYKAQYPSAKVFRIASANFPFMNPLALTNGAFGVPSQAVRATVLISRDDPVNPFRHSYSPLHDNLEQRAEHLVPYDSDFEVFSVQRNIEMVFQGPDQVNPEPQWGETVCGGVYRERVFGLGGPLDATNRLITVEGRFVLQRASSVGTLLQ